MNSIAPQRVYMETLARPLPAEPWLSEVMRPTQDWPFAIYQDLLGNGYQLTFTRSTKGWAWDAKGDLVEYASNAPRWWHDPTTGAAKGLLQEPADTELLGYTTRPMDWIVINGSREAAGTGIFGQFNAAKIVSDGTNRGGIANNISITSGTPYTIYFLYRAGNQGDGVRFLFYNGSTFSIARGDFGSVTTAVTGGGTVSVDEQLLLDGVTYLGRFTWTPNATSAGGQVRIECLDATNGDELIVLGRNVVATGDPYSFIVNTASGSLTREADVCSWSLPADYGDGDGETWLHEGEPWVVNSASHDGRTMTLRGGTSEDVFMAYFVNSSSSTEVLVNNGTYQFQDSYTGADAANANEPLRQVLSYGSGGGRWSINGLTAKTDASVSPPDVDTMHLGRYWSGSALYRGTHKRLARIKGLYSAETVQALAS